MTVDQIITTERFKNFLLTVRNFCAFIENDQTENHLSFLKLTQMHLQSLYFDAQKLPTVDLDYNLDFENLLTKTELEHVLNGLDNKLDKRFYWHVFDPTKEDDIEPVCGDLLDDLGDIYQELKNSLLLYDKGTPAEMENAIWTVQWSFDNHWGNHCIDATYALHYFIQNAG